ncbi:hypothetical protein RRSWK_03881 [Rhodopirellula sp. SWK7]|nr:hypothetical protein RRSWK_03881 [Rhodopirellula sp. SWK7]
MRAEPGERSVEPRVRDARMAFSFPSPSVSSHLATPHDTSVDANRS